MVDETIFVDAVEMYVRVLAGLTLFITYLVGVIGNVTILTIIFAVLRKRKNIPNVLILILGVVDLCAVFVIYKQTLITYIAGRYIGGYSACKIHAVLILFFSFFSIIVTTAMVYDRYFAVSKPYWYQNKMVYSVTKVVIFLTCCIILSILIVLPIVLEYGKSVLHFPGTYCLFSFDASSDHDRYMLISYTLLLSIIALLIIIGNTAGCINVYKMVSYRSRYSTEFDIKKTEEYLFLRLSFVTLFVFLLIWLPFYILMLLSLFNANYPEWYRVVAVRFAALQCVINPWLHPTLRRKFRRAFFWVFHQSIGFLTCGCIEPSSLSLDQVLSDENENIEIAREQIELHDANEFTGNVTYDIAQRNLTEFVDGPDHDGPNSFRSYSNVEVPRKTYSSYTPRQSYDNTNSPHHSNNSPHHSNEDSNKSINSFTNTKPFKEDER